MKEWIEIISTVVGQIVIASAVAYIAFKTYAINKEGFKISKNQLRLALFDRRFKIFEAFRQLFMDFLFEAKIDDKKFSTFLLNTVDSEFLFGKEVFEYRKEVIEKCIRLRQLHRKFEKDIEDADDREKLAKEAENIEVWLSNQKEEISRIFRKYLHFSINAQPR